MGASHGEEKGLKMAIARRVSLLLILFAVISGGGAAVNKKGSSKPQPQFDLAAAIASYIDRTYKPKGYQLPRGENQYTVVYVAGMNADGTLNNNEPNRYNDRRILLTFAQGKPQIAGNWQATVSPGSVYENPRLAYTQFGLFPQAYRIGIHGMVCPHEALVQVKPIIVARGPNQQGEYTNTRIGKRRDEGVFAINQHGPCKDSDTVDGSSEGCLVARRMSEHRQFMSMLKTDIRYKTSPVGPPIHSGDPPYRTFAWDLIIISGQKLLESTK
jgi:hypothetical protein